jgi:colanic acid/amylovoran biosynthesis glycosyltransferase
VLVEGACMAGKLMALDCPEEKIVIQKIGVDLQKIPYTPRTWKHGETLRVLMAASFRQKKGIPLALKALASLQNDVKLEIILIGDAGNDSETTEQKKIITCILNDYGLIDKTQLPGYLPYDKIFEIAKDCHLFLHPSLTALNGDDEGGSPVIITEMAASGMAVVSTFHCDIPDVIMHGRSGFLARENDTDDLIIQIKKCIESSANWPSMLDAGRKHIEKEYDIEVQTKKMIAIYQELYRENCIE